jgi:hypothetical protein
MEIISLTCEKCGAKLDVRPDTETFFCTYCGTQQRLKRSAGMAIPRQLQESVERVDEATGRAAAQLAAKRIRGMLAAVEAERASGVGSIPRSSNAPIGIGAAIVGSAVLVPIFWYFIGGWAILAVAAMIVGAVYGQHKTQRAVDAVNLAAAMKAGPLYERLSAFEAKMDKHDLG